jgi:hypothetical protein
LLKEYKLLHHEIQNPHPTTIYKHIAKGRNANNTFAKSLCFIPKLQHYQSFIKNKMQTIDIEKSICLMWLSTNRGLNARQADVLNSTFVLSINFSNKLNNLLSIPALRQAPTRCKQAYWTTQQP